MSYFDEVLRVLSDAEKLGARELSNGVKLIGHVPHIGPEAYLHTVFPSIGEDKVDKIEEDIQRALPNSLKEFFSYANGIHLFSGSFSIDGYRESYIRSGDGAYEPFSITTPNVDVEERLDDAPEDAVFFGFYDWDGSQNWMTPSDPRVFRCSSESAEPLNIWSNFETMLVSEVKRLSTLFDKKGNLIDEEMPTTPPE